MMFSHIAREEMKGEKKEGAAKNIADFLKRQFCPDRRGFDDDSILQQPR